MNNAIYGKTTENFKNYNQCKTVNIRKDYLKCRSKPSYMSHKVYDNNSVAK